VSEGGLLSDDEGGQLIELSFPYHVHTHTEYSPPFVLVGGSGGSGSGGGTTRFIG